MTLAELQTSFHCLATGATPLDHELADELFAGTPGLPAVERIRIYADMYRWRQVDALREEFPQVAAALGGERFYEAASAYVRAHPSESPDLGQLGRRFAAFLAHRPELAGRPDLADLAALEWARSEVFAEEDASAVGRDSLARVGADAFAEARVRFVPGFRLVRLTHDAARLWRELASGGTAAPPVRSPTAVAVWRSGFDVFHVIVPPDEAAAIEAAIAYEPLGLVCAAFQDREDAARAAFEALAGWAEEGWISAVEGA